MKRFLLQFFIFSFTALSAFVYLLSFADGTNDPFYLRFTSPSQNNLIIGTSRAAQGLQPQIINKICGTEFYNYAFTLGRSPFGKTYLNSIKKKINKETKNGKFIITVDPWSICSDTKKPNDSNNFGEIKLCLGNTPFVNMNPNPFYLINNYDGKLFTIFTEDMSYMKLQKDGWLEVTINMDSSSVNSRTEAKLKTYRERNLIIFKYSDLRLKYLEKTIKFLNSYGHVYLVRLPVHKQMMEIENELMPEFDDLIQGLVPSTSGYLDMTLDNKKYNYIDGNHLHKESGKTVSEKIGLWIKNK